MQGIRHYVGIVIKNNQVVDLMAHQTQDESECNLLDSPVVKGADSVTCWLVNEDDCTMVKDMTAEAVG